MGAAASDRLGAWCGWVLIGGAALTPLLAWLGPKGFAPLMGLLGLLCLPAFRIGKDDRLMLGALAAGVAWAAVSILWSRFPPALSGPMTAVKLALQLPLYWAVICGARRADSRLARRALAVLAWGMAAFGLVLLAEAATGAEVYRRLHVAGWGPIRPDIAQAHVGHATFIMALLWPVAAAGVGKRWLAAPMAAGLLAAAVMFGSDAPVAAVALSALSGLMVYAWPRLGPRVIAAKALALFLGAPVIVAVARQAWGLERLQAMAPLSWGQRMGYWSHALDRIVEKPLLGWGLDASRTFAPDIVLHPHDAPLQIWLEMGVPGAVLAAIFWAAAILRLQRPARDIPAAAAAASLAAYLLFAAVNFGVWQEWWLALGAWTVAMATLGARQAGATMRPST